MSVIMETLALHAVGIEHVDDQSLRPMAGLVGSRRCITYALSHEGARQWQERFAIRYRIFQWIEPAD